MPFIGQDWRGPGGKWVRISFGWENVKLHPLQSDSKTKRRSRVHSESESSNELCADVTSQPSGDSSALVVGPCGDDGKESEQREEVPRQPHCFVKNKKSKEFVGCTSMSEAFLKLDLARAVADVRRFNYISKVIQILVKEKLQNLSGSARRVLLSLVEATVVHCLEEDKELSTVRGLLSDFMHGLNQGFHCGSPTMLSSHKESLGELFTMLQNQQPTAPADSNEDSVTILDLPMECLQVVLRQLPDHRNLMGATEALNIMASYEGKLWEGLCQLHFSEQQLEKVFTKLGYGKRVMCSNAKRTKSQIDWRHVYFESKKYYGLRELYADMIHICCHCKALYWKDLGHPCVSNVAAPPAVRVTPQQFIDMLLYI